VSRRRKNERALARGAAARASDVAHGRQGSRGAAGLLPSVAIPPGDRAVDAELLALELPRLVELARRGWNT
jgi:hypothetical protein